ncbi:MAG: hypothetical protein LAT68_13940 [Cyclobacteriaceae bacterium]|nr:hypothetical protein [Cyclobacteriaceae bacterium]MCH8517421.1 hypothetical protein [Cyclobacteriaceae bacterium]
MKLSIAEKVHLVEKGDFEPSEHWYPRVLNSNIHPLVAYFLNLTHEQLVERYSRLSPKANKDALFEILRYQPKYFRWSGTDLMHVTNQEGNRAITVIETNSCPSGQKSMPLLDLNKEQGGYERLIAQTFKPMVDKHDAVGSLAVIYDKNPMENIGYAATIADVFDENVYLAEYKENSESVKFEDNQLYIFGGDEEGWIPIRAAFRYVTQQPWNRIPQKSKTLLVNPIEACLAGGRNKEVASQAYEDFNAKFAERGIQIFTPKTYSNVPIGDLEHLFHELGGSMVIKAPDSNAGQGVMTIVNEAELKFHLAELRAQPATHFLVQQLIHANYVQGTNPESSWYHVGSLPDKKGRTYAFDIRLMMHATEEGIRPLAAYSRKSRHPLNEPIPEGMSSWEVYGTNLSVKEEDGWSYEDQRLNLFDIRNFGQLGLGVDELIRSFVQSVMAVYAIDQHAQKMFD